MDTYSAVAMYQNLHDQEKMDQAVAIVQHRIATNGDADAVNKYLKGLGVL
jgi:hypothetical protein